MWILAPCSQPISWTVFGVSSQLVYLGAFFWTQPAGNPAVHFPSATTAPAKALKQQGKLGCIRTGAFADMIAVPGSGSLEKACTEVLSHTGRVPWLMVNGALHHPAGL